MDVDRLDRAILGSGHQRLHLHGFERQQHLAPGDPLAHLHGEACDGAGHRGCDFERIALARLAALVCGLYPRMLDAHAAWLAVQLVEQLAGTLARQIGAALQTDDQRLAGIDVDADLLVLGQAIEEAGGRQRTHVPIGLLVLDIILVDLGIHEVAGEIGIAQLHAQIGFGPGALGFEIDSGQACTGALGECRFATQNLGLQRQRPALRRQAEFAAKQLHHRFREVDHERRVCHLGGGQALRHHEQRQVAHHLAAGCDFHDVAEQTVHVRIGLADLAPAVGEAHAARLFSQIGVLAAGHLVTIDIRRAAANIRLERRVEAPHAFPVIAELLHGGSIRFRVAGMADESGGDAAEIGLAGESAQAVERAIHRITSGFHRRQHAGCCNAAGVVGVEVDGQSHFLLERAHQLEGRTRLADAGHVLDAEDVRTRLLQRLRHLHVVGEVELGPRGIEQIARVTERALADAARLDHRIHRHPHVLHTVERVEDAKDVDALRRRLLHEVTHHVVCIVGVAHGIGGAQQHLEGDVGHRLAQRSQARPGVFLEKAQRHIESCTAPAFEREQVRQQARVVRGDGQHVGRAHAGCEQALVRIAHRGVGEQHLRLRLHPFRKGLGTLSLQQVAKAGGDGCGEIGGRQQGRRHGGGGLGPALHVGIAVDHHLADEAQHLGRPVEPCGEAEQFRRGVDEARGRLAAGKQRMGDDVFEELQIGRDAANAELAQGAVHAADGDIGLRCPGGDLHQQGVVVRRDDGIGIHRAAIEPDAEARRAAIRRDTAMIRREAILRVFGGDAALQGVAAESEVCLLRQARIANGRALAHTDLRSDEIHTRHHLGHGVFHLDARIDLDEIEMAGVGIHQELDRAGMRVADAVAKSQSRRTERFALCLIQIRCRRTLHHFLVAPLHRAIALEQMHQIAVAVAQHLHLHMPGAAHQLLDIDRIVAEGGE
ncbi:MAG: hypothetical protein V4650_00355 [Pseudomonadota bacterium]